MRPVSRPIARVSALKVEPISNTPVVSRLMRVGSLASLGLFGIVVGRRRHGDDLAGVDVEDHAGGAPWRSNSSRLGEFVAQGELHAQIERKLHRLLQPVGGEPRHVQSGEPLPVEPFLDAGNALVVDIDVADLVRNRGAVRIDTLVLAEEADAGKSEPVNFLLLLGRDFALEPDEAALRRQPFAHFGGIEVRQHRRQQFNGFIDVDQLARLGKQRRRLDVGGDDRAIAVENVRPRRGDGVARDAAACAMAFAHRGEHHQPQRDNAVDRDEGDNGEAEPRLGFDVAVDIVAVEQRAQRALPAGFALGLHRGLHDAHRDTLGAGMLPVVSGAMMAAIGSAAGGGGTGRSGRLSKVSNCVD